MATSREAYVDTSALIAFLKKRCQPPNLGNLQVQPSHAACFWWLAPFPSLGFLSMIEACEPLVVIPVGAAEITAATAVLRRFPNQALTLVDAVGVHLMKARRSRSCWSTDRHLRLTGVPLVIDDN